MIIKARLNQINVLTFGVKSDYLPSELLVELQEFVLHSLDQIWNHACFLFIYFFANFNISAVLKHLQCLLVTQSVNVCFVFALTLLVSVLVGCDFYGGPRPLTCGSPWRAAQLPAL